jgi:hypothetical protein
MTASDPAQNAETVRVAQSRLAVVPITLREANAFVVKHHRHHKETRGHRWSLGIEDETGELRGVAIVGRSVARMLHHRRRCEVTRLCTDGCPNACSALYAAACRSKKEMGYDVAHTYILASESGVSLRAAGWYPVAESNGGSWSRPSRGRTDKAPLEGKVRWECRHSTAPEIGLEAA